TVEVLERLAEAIEELAIPAEPESLATVLALRDRLDARISEVVARFDAAGGWEADGATSAIGWLRDRGGMTSRDAGRTVGVARRLRALPATAKAWLDGDL